MHNIKFDYRVYPDGDIVLILLNMNNMTTSVTLRDTVQSSSSRDVYWLTPPGGTSDLQSRYMTYFSVNYLHHDHVATRGCFIDRGINDFLGIWDTHALAACAIGTYPANHAASTKIVSNICLYVVLSLSYLQP